MKKLMTIGPVAIHIIQGITLDDEAAQANYVEGFKANPVNLQTNYSRYVGPLVLPKNGWQLIRSFPNVEESYEITFEWQGRKFSEIVIGNRIEHHVQIDMPETLLNAVIGRPVRDVIEVEADNPIGWTGEEKIVGNQTTNDKRYLIVGINLIKEKEHLGDQE